MRAKEPLIIIVEERLENSFLLEKIFNANGYYRVAPVKSLADARIIAQYSPHAVGIIAINTDQFPLGRKEKSFLSTKGTDYYLNRASEHEQRSISPTILAYENRKSLNALKNNPGKSLKNTFYLAGFPQADDIREIMCLIDNNFPVEPRPVEVPAWIH